MNGILVYLLLGFVALGVNWLISVGIGLKAPIKEILDDLAHVVIFVLLWPIDLVYCIVMNMRYPEKLKERFNRD